MENLSFNKELEFDISMEDYFWSGGELKATYHPLDIYLYGPDEKILIEDLKLEILDLYDELTSTEDSKLAPHLVEQKKHLLQIITKNPT